MEHQILLIIGVISAFVHVVEEYKCGWIGWANGFVSGITAKQFMIINLLFVILCIVAAMTNGKYIVFSSSVFSLLLVNSLAHIAPTIKQRKYSPGVISAGLLFVPVGVIGYVNLLNNNLINIKQFMISILLGILWMSIPFVYQAVRISGKKRA